MHNGRTIAWIGLSVALIACGAPAHATAPVDSPQPMPVSDQASAQRVSLADGAPSGLHEAGPARGEARTATGKPEEPQSPRSDSFVVLGLLVVLIGVVARQKRRFSRSGTILSR